MSTEFSDAKKGEDKNKLLTIFTSDSTKLEICIFVSMYICICAFILMGFAKPAMLPGTRS